MLKICALRIEVVEILLAQSSCNLSIDCIAYCVESKIWAQDVLYESYVPNIQIRDLV